MAQTVKITPASGLLEFIGNTTSNKPYLQHDDNGNLTLTLQATKKFTVAGNLKVNGKVTMAQQTLTDGAAITWDFNSGANAKVTLAGARTLVISNMETGDTGLILVKQDAAGSRTLTLPGSSSIVGGGSYTASPAANATDVLGVYYDGTTYWWTIGYNTVTPPLTSVGITGGDFVIANSPLTANGNIGLALATVNSTVGTFGSATAVPVITVNAKGLVTAVSATNISIPTNLDSLTDVTITSAATNQLLQFNGSQWVNWTPNYITSYTETDTLATVTGRGATTNTAVTFNGNVTLGNSADLIFKDLAGTFPTSGKGFDWELNNDGARIYAIQPSSDSIDLVFQLRDNATTNDRFVFWVDDYQGAAYDKYPLIIRGGTEFDLVDSGLFVRGTQVLTNGRVLQNISGNISMFTNDSAYITNAALAGYATQTYVNTAVSNLVASAPSTLDTLNELATALGNDANFATTITTSIGTKQPQLNGTGFVKVSGTTVSYDNSTYLTTASAASTYVSLTGSYANPSWITSLAYSKITGVPAFLTSYTETDTLATVTGRGATTNTASIFGGGLYARGAQNDGDYSSAALWTESYNNTTTGIAFHISGIVGKFLEMRTDQRLYWDNEQVWHTGNLTNLNQLTNGPGYITGYTETNTFLGDGGSANTHPGTDRIIFTGQLSLGAAVLGMPSTDNSNAILNINRHPGEYNSQLGFSSNGSMYYRSFSATAINNTQAWRQVWDSDNLTNLNQLTNGPAYITTAALSGYATQTYVNTAISNLIDTAPSTLDTLNELAAALGDDPNFATSITTSIGNKVSKSGDTMTGALTINTTGTGGSPSLRINTSTAATFVHSQENLAANLTAGQHNILVVGKAADTKNSGYIGYNWAANASDSNFVTIGHWGADDLLRVYGNGVVTIGTNTVWHAGNDGAGSGLDADLLDGYHASGSVGANTVVIRDANGYIYANYINTNVGVDNPSIANFITDSGDGWMRKSSIAHVRNSLGNYGSWLTQAAADPLYVNVTGDTMTGPLVITGTTSGQELFAVNGVNGRLFTVSDDLSNSLFSVNTVAGLPVIEAFANNTVNIGPFSAPIVINASGIATPSHGTSANWNSAYNDTITSAAVSGTTSKTLTLTQRDGGTVTATWTDIDTDTDTDQQTLSVNGSTLSISGGNSITLPASGISQATADGLYVNISGDEMTGNLYISPISANPAQIQLAGTNPELYVSAKTGTARVFINREGSGHQATLMFTTGMNVFQGTAWDYTGAPMWSMGMTNNNNVNSFKIAYGDIYEPTLVALEITTANTAYFKYVPYAAGNLLATQSWVTSQGYITSYSETDTLASVTARGSSTNGSIYVNGLLTGGLGAATTEGTLDWNDSSNARAGQGHTLLLGNHSNGPGPGEYFHPVGFEYSSKNGSGNVTQLAISYGSPGNKMYMRGKYGGSWTGWTQFITSANIGGQSVNYAATAGALTSMNISQFTNNSGYLTSLPSHNHDDRYYTESEIDSQIGNRLYQARVNSLDVDAFNGTGLYRGSTSSWSNRPPIGNNAGALLQIDTHPSDYAAQLFFDSSADRLYLRNAAGGSWGSWNTMWHSGNDGAGSGLDADLLDGFHASVAATANSIPTRNASGYLIPESWIQLNGTYGLYSPTNNAHLRPNSGTYGSWQMTGSRNGWQGIEFDSGSNGNVSLMVSAASNTTGFHNNNYGWQFFWEGGTLYCFKNTYGAGTQATVLDSVNYTNYAATLDHTHGLGKHSLAAPANIDGLTATNFRNTLFGSASNTWNISTARWNTTPTGLSGMNSYGTMLAWSGSDTHGFIAVDYSTANIQVGGGSADNITWKATLIHSSNIGSQSVSFATTAGSLTSMNISQFTNNSGYLTSITSGNVTTALGYTPWHAGNDGAGSGLDADLLDGYTSDTAANVNTIVRRDASGNIYSNYVLGSYFNASAGNSANPTIGQIWTQDTSDNYLRKSTPAHFRSQVIDGYYLPLSGGTLSGSLNIIGELAFRDGSGDYSNIIRAAGYPSEGYDNSAIYWLEYQSRGGHHFVLNTDSGVGAPANTMDDFVIWQGAIDGDRILEVSNTGTLTIADRLVELSSIRYKTNVESLTPALDKVLQLRPVYYTKIGGTGSTEIGLIAEEVAEIYPELVKYNSEGQVDGINYTRIAPILIKTIQEQQELIKKLTERIENLENR